MITSKRYILNHLHLPEVDKWGLLALHTTLILQLRMLSAINLGRLVTLYNYLLSASASLKFGIAKPGLLLLTFESIYK